MYSGQLVATTTITDFPKDIRHLIFSFLTNHDPLQASQDILNLRMLSKEWNNIVMSYLSWLWEKKVKDGWLDTFMGRDRFLQQEMKQFYNEHKNRNMQELVAEQKKAIASRRTTGIGVSPQLFTHLVIRKKIQILAKLLENLGLPVPDSLQKTIDALADNKSELEMELAMLEIERMAGRGKNKKKMTAEQKTQIIGAIEDCLKSKEHKKGARTSTQQVHQEALARRKSEKWNRAQRIFQNSGFAAALNDAQRC